MYISPEAIRPGRLTSFGVAFPEDSNTYDERLGDENIDHLKECTWLCGTPTIHTLVCYGFRFLRTKLS